MIFDVTLALALIGTLLGSLFALSWIISLCRTGVPRVPTPWSVAESMCKMAAIKPGERVLDLGCGSGRLVHTAAAQGAEAYGYDLDRVALLWAKLFRKGNYQYKDIFTVDVSQADVVFLYLLPELLQQVEKQVLPTLPKGTRVVTHDFPLVLENKKHNVTYKKTRTVAGHILYLYEIV